MDIKPQLQQVYQDEYLKVSLDQTLKFIYVEWFRHADSPDFRRHFQMLADITIETKSKYWLSDARAIHYIAFADQNWLLRDMAPLLQQSNLIKFARLTTEESLLQMDVIRVFNEVERLTELGIKTKLELFTQKDAALSWLFEDINTAQDNLWSIWV